MLARLLSAAALLVLAAPLQAQQSAPGRAGVSERNLISPAEVRASTASDAYQLVRSLRSFWLSRREARLATTPSPPPRNDPEGPVAESEPRATQPVRVEADPMGGLVVILDTALLGGVEALREIPLNTVEAVEFLSPEQARLRHGRQVRDGAIVVRTRTSGR
jgi:hypothetical protein